MTTSWRDDEEAVELQHAALERAFAKQLAAREVVLVQGGKDGWRVVKLRTLGAADRDALLSKVYRSPEDEKMGWFQKVAERLDK